MSVDKSHVQGNYKVMCTSCGAVIRHNNVKESRGMCLACFAHMLDDYYRRSQRPDGPAKASER